MKNILTTLCLGFFLGINQIRANRNQVLAANALNNAHLYPPRTVSKMRSPLVQNSEQTNHPSRTTSLPTSNQYSTGQNRYLLQQLQAPQNTVTQTLNKKKPIKIGPFTFNKSSQKSQNPNEVPKRTLPKKEVKVGPFRFNIKTKPQIAPFYGPDPSRGIQNWELYPVKSLGKGVYGSATLVSDSHGNNKIGSSRIEQEISMAREAGYLVGHNPESRQILLKYVEGVPLKEYLKIDGRDVIDPKSRLDKYNFFVTKMQEAVGAVHSKKIAHLDNHDQNIIINKDGKA
ncbi:hypothetical protein O9G_005788, partial [Rozella allomycis CSF55]